MMRFFSFRTFNFNSRDQVKKFIDNFKNIWAIEELRNKIIVTLAFVLTYRLGTQITLPGINPNLLEAAKAGSSKNGLLGLFDTFAGGAFSQASILALGIMPYISASIFMQLMTILIPYSPQWSDLDPAKYIGSRSAKLDTLVSFLK